MTEFGKIMNEKDTDLKTLKNENQSLKQDVVFYQQKINFLNNLLEAKDTEIKAKIQTVECLQENIKNLETRIENLSNTNHLKNEMVDYNSFLFTRLDDENARLRLENEKLKAKLNKIELDESQNETSPLKHAIQVQDVLQFAEIVEPEETTHKIEAIDTDFSFELTDETELNNSKQIKRINKDSLLIFNSNLKTNLDKYNLKIVNVDTNNRSIIIDQEAMTKNIQLCFFDRMNLIKVIKIDSNENLSLDFLKLFVQFKICTKLYGSSGFSLRKTESSHIKNSIRFTFNCRNQRLTNCKNKICAMYFIEHKVIFISWTGTRCDCKK
ncbi:unnamed protein product [Brachionus calyciflorus]|uniref:Uncharacterized protein n=1 Tax=Brachionus calyciflorus TaxID=104777 RepID=A0A814PXR0_9BILA|nr:unnamed protein product [Brachionus calyciflorus]